MDFRVLFLFPQFPTHLCFRFSKRKGNTEEALDTSSSLSDSDSLALEVSSLSTTPHDTTGLNLENGIIIAGIPNSLVSALAHFHFSNNEYISEFLFSYRGFMDSKEVLTKLIERFVDVDEKLLFTDTKEKNQMTWFVRLRVIKVLKLWLKDFYFDFDFDDELFQSVKRFISDIMPKEFEKYSVQLKALLQEKHHTPVYKIDDRTFCFFIFVLSLNWLNFFRKPNRAHRS